MDLSSPCRDTVYIYIVSLHGQKREKIEKSMLLEQSLRCKFNAKKGQKMLQNCTCLGGDLI